MIWMLKATRKSKSKKVTRTQGINQVKKLPLRMLEMRKVRQLRKMKRLKLKSSRPRNRSNIERALKVRRLL